MPCLQLVFSYGSPTLVLSLRCLIATTLAAAAISLIGCRAEATSVPATTVSQSKDAAFSSDTSYFPHQYQNQATEVEPLPPQF
jgi:hypothetical protein